MTAGSYTKAYYSASLIMEEVRVTEMTKADFVKFVTAGEVCLALYDKMQNEEKAELESIGIPFELPPVVEFPIRLPDMYMRFGYWNDAKRVYEKCRESRYLCGYDIDFNRLSREADEKRECVYAIMAILRDGEHSQKAIKKQLANFTPQVINWSLRFYKGIKREKNGSDYTVELAEIPI